MDAIEALKLIEDWEDAREKQLRLHLAFQAHDYGPRRGDPVCREYWETYDAVIEPGLEVHIKLLKPFIAAGMIEGLLGTMPSIQRNLEARIKDSDEIKWRLDALVSKYGASSSGRTIN